MLLFQQLKYSNPSKLAPRKINYEYMHFSKYIWQHHLPVVQPKNVQ
jgi:hypothetical protein